MDALIGLPGSEVECTFAFAHNHQPHPNHFEDGDYAVLVTNILYSDGEQLKVSFTKEEAFLNDTTDGDSGQQVQFDLSRATEADATELLRFIFKVAREDRKINLLDVLSGGKPKPAGQQPANIPWSSL